uniref:Tachykinin precursor 4 n=1 Tax=Mandrillus leucophaeus TaxID=9568 RepID=A0A2K5ZQQ5_MANLE
MLPCLASCPCALWQVIVERNRHSTEAETWITVALEEGAGPSIRLQLQEVKMGKASQFFGLMGKRVGGRPLIQPRRKKGLLGKRSLSTEGREDEAQGSE